MNRQLQIAVNNYFTGKSGAWGGVAHPKLYALLDAEKLALNSLKEAINALTTEVSASQTPYASATQNIERKSAAKLNLKKILSFLG